MAVIVFPANVSFINLDNAAKFGFRLNKRRADFVAHIERGLIGTEAHLPLNLQRANSFFAAQHQVDHFKPLAKRLVGVFKNGARDVRESITRALDRLTLIALPFKRHRTDRENLCVAATRASDTIRPATSNKIGGDKLPHRSETRLELRFGHLMDWLWTLGHDDLPAYGGNNGL